MLQICRLTHSVRLDLLFRSFRKLRFSNLKLSKNWPSKKELLWEKLCRLLSFCHVKKRGSWFCIYRHQSPSNLNQSNVWNKIGDCIEINMFQTRYPFTKLLINFLYTVIRGLTNFSTSFMFLKWMLVFSYIINYLTLSLYQESLGMETFDIWSKIDYIFWFWKAWRDHNMVSKKTHP